MDRYQGIMTSPESEVREKLGSINFPPQRTHIMKGWVEDTLAGDDAPRKVAFAYVDFDFYEPIRTALEFLDRAMPVGGRIVVDDYGYFSAGVQKAVDDFVASRKDRFAMSLPLPFAGKFAMIKRIG
jgi:O-methyltransferase